MIDKLCQGDESKSICFSQINKLYRVEFLRHVKDWVLNKRAVGRGMSIIAKRRARNYGFIRATPVQSRAHHMLAHARAVAMEMDNNY